MFYASIVPRKQKKPFIQSSDLPLNISHFRHPTPKLVEKTPRKAPIHQNIAYWFQTPGIIGETNFHPLSPTFNVDTHTKEWNSGQKTHRPTLKGGGGGFEANVEYFWPNTRIFLNSFGVGCLNLAWCRIFTLAHRMDMILSHIWHMAQRSIAKKFGKVFTSWRHLMTSSKFLGADRFWPYVAIWQVMTLWSIDFCLEWCIMLHFFPKRLSCLSCSIDRRFVKFQCIDIKWWRHNPQNRPNLRIFTRSDHLPSLWL